VECGECLCERKTMRDSMKMWDVTLFCCRAVARCCAPCGPMSLQLRFSVVSAYGTQENERFDGTVEMLPCFVEEHWQDVVLLVDRSCWS